MPGKHNVGCKCCNPCKCDGTIPWAFIITLSNSEEEPFTLAPSGSVYVRTSSAGVVWTLSLTEGINGCVVRVTRVDTAAEGDPTTIWEADISAYVPLDCCVDLEDLTLTCVSSDEDYCTAGVTLAIRAVCTAMELDPCSYCAFGTPSLLRLELRGFSGAFAGWNGVYFLPYTDSCFWSIDGTTTTPSITVLIDATYTTGRVKLYKSGSYEGTLSPGPSHSTLDCISFWGTAEIRAYPLGGTLLGYADVEAD